MHTTLNHMIVGLSLTGASKILGQDMNLVNTPQCHPSRGWQYVAPEMDRRECTLHLPPQCESGRTHSGFETQRRHHQKSKTVQVAPKIGHANVSDKEKTKKELIYTRNTKRRKQRDWSSLNNRVYSSLLLCNEGVNWLRQVSTDVYLG